MMSECGDKEQAIIKKSDQEPAIKALVDDVSMARARAKTIPEKPPIGSKGSIWLWKGPSRPSSICGP